MGHTISSFLDRLLHGPEIRILMVGPMEAGKSTIVHKLKTGEFLSQIQTIRYNVETIKYKNIRFFFCDVAGTNSIQSMWRFYKMGHVAVIYVVDSTDREGIKEAESELYAILNSDEQKDVVVLLFANKQDLPNALSPSKVAEEMKMHTLKQDWYVQGTCAQSGSGLYEGLDHLLTMLEKKKLNI